MIRPEDEPPINKSPGFAFRVAPKKAGAITVKLHFVGSDARYWPNVSKDGMNWRAMNEFDVVRSDDDETIRFQENTGCAGVPDGRQIIPAVVQSH